MNDDILFTTIINQAKKKGVDFITVHCGITQDTIKAVDDSNV